MSGFTRSSSFSFLILLCRLNSRELWPRFFFPFSFFFFQIDIKFREALKTHTLPLFRPLLFFFDGGGMV